MIDEPSQSLQRPDVARTAARTLFRHDTLDRNTDSFRLIQIRRDRSQEGHIQLSLWQDSISSATYQCLSYRWGDATRQHSVVINGELFDVGENLYEFLQEAHNDKCPLGAYCALWIDALCINQNSTQERGHQVQRMGHIYSKAKRVLIWLGARHTQAPALCDWILSSSESCPKAFSAGWQQICSDPYWYRAWIVQEVLLSQSVTVVLPGATIEYRALGRAIARFTDLSRLDEASAAQLWTFWDDHWSKPRDRAQAHSTVDWLRHDRDRTRFWELIHLQKTSKCADKRDRVYSLLGLVSGDLKFPVNYEEDAVDLFWRAGEHFNAWEAPELVDILRIALLNNDFMHDDTRRMLGESIDPWELVESLNTRPDLQLRIAVRRAISTTSLPGTTEVSCASSDCHRAPPLECTRDDILLCTNAKSSGPTEHGCIHALATPLNAQPAQPAHKFSIRLEAHHGNTTAHTYLPAEALQVADKDTITWKGVGDWVSLSKVLDENNLDRTDRVKLLIPAKYAVWIWYGVHPDELEQVYHRKHRNLPSARHILPVGTRFSRKSIELPG